MSCNLAHDLITRTLSGNASTREAADLRDHLTGCASCAEMSRRLGRVWELSGKVRTVGLSDARARAVNRQVHGSRRPLWIPVAAAAALLLGLVVYLAMPSVPDEPTSDPISNRIDPVKEPMALPAPKPEEAPKALPAPVEKPAPVPAPSEKPPAPAVAKAPEPEKAPDPAPLPVEKPLPPIVQKIVPVTAPEPPKPKPSPRTVVAPVAVLAEAGAETVILTAQGSIPAKAGARLLPGQGVQTKSSATVVYEDGSRLDLGPDTIVARLVHQVGKTSGKLVVVDQGRLMANVAKQPAGESMVFATPHARARVLGTEFTLTVRASATLLEVTKGRVRLTRNKDGASANVSANHFAVAADSVKPTSRTNRRPKVIFSDAFQRSRWGQAWAQRVDSGSSPRFRMNEGRLSLKFSKEAPSEIAPGGLLPTEGGQLDPDLAKKAVDSALAQNAAGSAGAWPRSAWLETRGTFPLGRDVVLRIKISAWQSHADTDRTTWICLNRKVAERRLLLERRGKSLALWAAGRKVGSWETPEQADALEIWLTPTQIVLRRDGKTIHAGKNPCPATAVWISLGGGAKQTLAREEEIRFDDLEVSWLTRADWVKVLK